MAVFADRPGSSATLSGHRKMSVEKWCLKSHMDTGTHLHTESSGDATKTYNGTITNKGTFDWLGGGPIACSVTTFVNEGTFNCKAAGTFLADTGTNGQTFDNRGTLNTFAGDNFASDTGIINSGILNIGLSGAGRLEVPSFSNSGTVNLGVGDILNSYNTLEATSKINVAIAGAADGQFGQLKSGNFNNILNGTLTANFVNGYSPPDGTSFRVIAVHHTADSSFSSVKAQNLLAKTVVLVDDPNRSFSDLVVQDLALSINDVSVLEGNSGTGSVNFTITLSQPAAANVTVKYATANGSAIAPG